MISRDTIDKVFSVLQIEDVIGDFVQLKRSGANYKGLSPFADEKTPSFMVSPSKGIWKDFSSGKGGNAVTFVMEMEHCSYPDAIRYIAQKYNIDIEETALSPQAKAESEERDSLYIVTEYAADWFKHQLHDTSQGRNIALTYFHSRGISDGSIEKFALGYSPEGWSAFTDEALKKGYKAEFLEKTGLSIHREDGRYNDRFRGRVIFPIHTFSGRVAGFGGRTMLGEKSIAKYLNSPESDIYHKSDMLYGLFQSKNAIIKSDSCYLVEGYMDVISMHQSGVENVVASSGTSLTDGQIRQIKRLTQNITVLYDGDTPGIKASFRGIDMLLGADMNVRVLTFPDGDDPDSFARKHTAAELKEYLDAEKTDFIDFKAKMLLEEAQGDPILKSRLVREIVVSISKISDHIKRELYLKECSRIMDVSEASLFRELAQIDQRNSHEYAQQAQKAAERASAAARLTVAKNEEKDPYQNIRDVEKDIIRIMLLHGDMPIVMEETVEPEDENAASSAEKQTYKTTIAREIIDSLTVDAIAMTDMTMAKIYAFIKNMADNAAAISHEGILRSDDTEIIQTVSDIMTEPFPLHKWSKVGVEITSFEFIASIYTRDLILRYKDMHVSMMIASTVAQMNAPDISEEDRIKCMERLKQLTTTRVLLNKELGNRVV